MVWGALRGGEDTAGGAPGARLTHARLLAMAVATSIDALAVGVSFVFMQDVVIFPACLVIGLVTFLICVAGGSLGKYIPWRTGKRAEVVGGLILIGIGIPAYDYTRGKKLAWRIVYWVALAVYILGCILGVI